MSKSAICDRHQKDPLSLLFLLDSLSSPCGLDFASRLPDLAILCPRSSLSLSWKDNGDAWSYLPLWITR